MIPLAAASGLDLGAKLENENVQGVALDVPVDSPYGFDQVVSGYDAPRTSHQMIEKHELRSSEDDVPIAPMDLMRLRVQGQVGDLQDGFRLRCMRRAMTRSRAASTSKENGFVR